MLKNISVKSYKSLSDISVSFSSRATIIVGNNFSGKKSLLELVPFVFSHTPDFRCQESMYFSSGITLLEPKNMSLGEDIEFSLEFDESTYCARFFYEGGTYGAWNLDSKSNISDDLVSESLKSVKVYSFIESDRNSFVKSAPSIFRSSGEGLMGYLSHLAGNEEGVLGRILTSMKEIFPELDGAVILSEKSSFIFGCGDKKECDSYQSSCYFFLDNGQMFPLDKMPISFITALACLTICSSKHTSNLILIDEFDVYLDVDRSFKLFFEMEKLASISEKQVILSSTKIEFLMIEGKSRYI